MVYNLYILEKPYVNALITFTVDEAGKAIESRDIIGRRFEGAIARLVRDEGIDAPCGVLEPLQPDEPRSEQLKP